MIREEIAAEAAQAFAYERRKDSAVIWRCFSRDTRAEIPEQLDGLLVTELAPYAFSAHMEEEALKRRIEAGELQLYVPEVLRGNPLPAEEGEAKWSMQTPEAAQEPRENLVPQAAGEAKWSMQTPEAAQEPRENRVPQAAGETEGKKQLSGAAEDILQKIPALCGEALEEIILPRTVRRVGRYCFYDCRLLRCVSFHGALGDWGSGVFTRCHRVCELSVCADAQGRSYLKDVLDELPEALTVEYRLPEQSAPAVLVFPEFYEEGVENTPARILETHVHGSGISYRNCFQGRTFDFVQYDTLFPHARALESCEVLVRMVLGRLRQPLGLSKKAKEQYEAYLREQAEAFADFLLQQRDLEGLRWMVRQFSDWEQEREALLAYAAEQASRLQNAEAVGYLMDCRRGRARTGRKRLEL